MTETTFTTESRVRRAGLLCMIGGLTFGLYFMGLSALLDLFSPPLEQGQFATVKLVVRLAADLCLASGLLGLLALRTTGRKK